MFQNEKQFLQKIESNLSTVMKYEDPRLQTKAREIIPVSDLHKDAEKRLSQVRSASNTATLGFQDCFILSLLTWFKSFFKWVDAPECERCHGKPSIVGMTQATPQELMFGASRVENYKCNQCNIFVRFPRYNDPGKLLDTRRGRCGEWANCFTLCCRATGFEARFVVDWTDHVWTEVYSLSQKRWLHCDPCENTCDKPLLYEKGWGKKLSYVIAISKDEVLDVSSRYTADRIAMRLRRTEVREDWLANICYRLWKERQKMLPEARQTELRTRMVSETVELLNQSLNPKSDDDNLGGRTTGSVEWRVARGETGDSAAKVHEPYVFKLTETEIQNKTFHLRYSFKYLKCNLKLFSLRL